MTERTLVAATGNKNKLAELTRILAPMGITLRAATEAELEGIVEDGQTFADNACIKARHVFLKSGLPSVADDSGLCVDALNGRPGVYSARYLGEHTDYSQKMAGILQELEGLQPRQRGARFVSAIAIVTANDTQFFEAACEGSIGFAPKGSHGFGYDPIFMVGEQSYAELSDSEKDAISHRGKALELFCAALEQDKIKF